MEKAFHSDGITLITVDKIWNCVGGYSFSFMLLWIGNCGEGHVYKTSILFFSSDLGNSAI